MRLPNCFLALMLLPVLSVCGFAQPDNAPKNTRDLTLINDAKTAAANDAQADEIYRQSAVLVARFLEDEHFARHPIDATTSKEWIENYMKSLDYNHLFFLQSDVDSFINKYALSIADNIRQGNLDIAFDIFKVFQQRTNDRMQWVNQRLGQPFDFTEDDYYTTDRSKVAWPKSPAEADKVWNERLKYDVLQERLSEKKTQDNSINTIRKRYELFKKNLDKFDHEDVIETYLTSLCSLYDPHTNFMSRKSEEDFKIAMQLKLVGIGAVLSSKDGYCTIEEIISGGPADLDKRLKPGDKIIGVAQGNDEYVDIIDMPLRNAVRMIRGDKGTTVRLKVIPSGGLETAREEIKLVRNEVKVNQQRAKAQLIERVGPDGKTYRIGVVKLSAFYNIGMGDDNDSNDGSGTGCSDDVRALINKLKEKQIDGLILDLRNNGGGLLTEAVKLVGLFIDKGPVVQVKDSQGRIQVLNDEDPGMAYDGPLMVMTNKLSASASEIAAGALQNYQRAIVIGDKSTHGKGTVQTVAELKRFIPSLFGQTPDSGSLKITIQKFYLPNGHSTQMRGVIPDIQLPSALDYMDLGEASLPHALPWDEINSTQFVMWNKPYTNYLELLNKDSAQRIAADPEFKLMQDDIARVRQRMEDKRTSLNEAKRVTEDADNKKHNEERDKTIKEIAAKLPPPITYSFDDKNQIVEKVGNDADDKKDQSAAANNTNDANSDDNSSSKKLSTTEAYAADLSLRETSRIMVDYLNQVAAAANKK